MGRPRGLLGRLVPLDRCPGDRAMPGLQPSGAELLGGVERLGGWRALLGLAVGVDRVDTVFVRHITVIAVGDDPAHHGGDVLRVAGYRYHGHRWSDLHGLSQRAAEPRVFEDRVEAVELTRLGDGRRREDGVARRGFRHDAPPVSGLSAGESAGEIEVTGLAG